MNLTFLNPFFLFGLAAGIIPVLIHRLTKRNAVPRKFSAVRLLLQSQQVMARPQRLKHLFLLALRVLTVLSLVFLMARPVLTSPGLLTKGRGAANILILDNSLSMGYRGDEGERFGLAKRVAKELVESFKGKVLLIPTSSIEGHSFQEEEMRWVSPKEALQELNHIPLTYGRGDPAASLDRAYHKLKELKTPAEILILSDMTKGDWEGFNLSRMKTFSGETSITFVRIGRATRDSNSSIKEATFVEGEPIVGVPLRLEATVSNLSDQSGSPLVQLYLSGVKRDQKSITLKPGEEGKVSFELSFDRPGWVNGEARLSGDRLVSDDVFYFSVKVRDKIKVLVVDGDPRTSLRAGESYYLVSALHPGGEASPFSIRVITEGEFSGHDLRPYDTVFLLNVARPQASKLTSVLESSKPVFIFLGDRVVPEDYNGIPLFPWRIREVRDLGTSKPETIAQIDMNHDSLKPFSGPTGESLRKASFYRYFRTDGSKKNLLILNNRDPLLSEADLGKEKLFLFTSTADLDWNDLPLKAAYLPLIQGLLKEAVGLGRKSFSKGIRIGESFEEKIRPIQMNGPEKGPGIYQFSLPSGEVRRGVNPPLEESDLSKVTPEEIKKKFGTIDVKVVEYQEGTLAKMRTGKKELWPFVLGFLLVVLAVEMGVANGIPKSSSLSPDGDRR
ncbi:MAG TPA: BatA domain-containing protein [Thermodesulfobacteriota bacterium]|nr:BatA domain-containing protein [Thermodesulfobacteriota bacterium]